MNRMRGEADSMRSIERWVAPDGTRLALRELRAEDAMALGTLFESMSTEDRRRRFHVGVGALPQTWLEALAGVDQARHVAFAAATVEAPEGPLIAEARWAIDEKEGEAEFALAVAPAWRRRGVGFRCIQALLRAASARGLARLYGSVLVDNLPMLAFARRCGFRAVGGSGTPGLVVIEARMRSLD
jgi:RimJ/RimL family protein N-acetyltransferase